MKRFFSLLMAAALLLGLCGCGASDASTPGPSGETRVFTDDVGREVVLPADIDRVIPAGGLAQIVLFSFCPEKLAGLSSRFAEGAKDLIPDEYYALPYFGQFYGSSDLNLEELAKAAPQLVVEIGDSKKNQNADLDAFTAQTGIPIVFLYCDLAGTADTFRRLGELFGMESLGEERAAYFAGLYERALGIMDKVGDSRVRTLYVQGDLGLNVLAKGSYHAEVLDMITDNIAVVDEVSNRGLGNEVSMEQIALWDPDYVIFKYGSVYHEVKDLDVWSRISAIQNGTYAECPEFPDCWLGMPPSIQRYLSLIWLPAVLYPEHVDYDLKEEIKVCCRILYGIELTDGQYEMVMSNGL